MTATPKHEFTVLVRGVDLLAEENLNTLFEAGCDDATFGQSQGAYYGSFNREADSFAAAVATAIDGIERAVPGARVYRVQP